MGEFSLSQCPGLNRRPHPSLLLSFNTSGIERLDCILCIEIP